MAHTKKKEQKRTVVTKDVLLKHLEQNIGNVTLACNFAQCSRSTFYRYYNNDVEFKQRVDEIQELAIDICEAELWKLIKDGNATAILFYLKTKGKTRGYVERQELTGMDGKPINWSETKTYVENDSINKTDNGN